MLALQALCAFEAVGDAFSAQVDEFLHDEQVLADLGLRAPPPPEVAGFAGELARGAWARRRVLDEKLAQTAAHWSVGRMTPVDRNILRLGLHELLSSPDNPPQVVINEAIELARLFGDTDSPAFVNGVLDAVWHALGSECRTADVRDQETSGSRPERGAESGADAEHGTV